MDRPDPSAQSPGRTSSQSAKEWCTFARSPKGCMPRGGVLRAVLSAPLPHHQPSNAGRNSPAVLPAGELWKQQALRKDRQTMG